MDQAGPSQPPNRPLSPRQREKSPISPDAVCLPPSSDHEITLMIADYLTDRYPRLADAVAAELGPARDEAVRGELDAVERAILDGDFGALEGLLSNPTLIAPQSQKAFLYMCWRQQFLEFVDNRESQKAFNLLQKRLKPLEHYQPVPYDFYSLAYLTSASTVHDAPGFRDWAGAGPERERLVAMWRELTDNERQGRETSPVVLPQPPKVPRERLINLLHQAGAWQVTSARPRGEGPYNLRSLFMDYSRPCIPSKLERLVRGHQANVKCVDFLRSDYRLALSGSSDATIQIFSVDDGVSRRVLTGHHSRIWDVLSSPHGSLVASGSGDGTVRIWRPDTGECARILSADGGDVYGIAFQPGSEEHIVSASYDRILRAWDIESGKLVRTFSGHSQSTLSVAFDYTGKLIASGSKDKHIRLWDNVGGVCVQTMTAHLGEITSVEFDNDGKYLLAGCKDNSNRLWDLRMQRNIYRYTGHQNSSKNIIRATFASQTGDLIASGSEDGLVYLWERECSAGESSMRTSAVNSPLMTPVLLPVTAPGAAGVNSRSATLSVPASTMGSATRTPAYLPPRSGTERSTWSGTGTPAPTTVRPLKALAGHGAGAVFDVRAHAGTLLSAGEDGAVGVWGGDS